MIPDGVFAQNATGKVVFHKLRPRQEDIGRAAKVLAKLDAETIEPDALDAVRGMSKQGELAIKVESVEEASGRMLASADGFSLQAARHLHESDRAGLAFLVQYVLRPPLALSRVSELPSGNIVIRLKGALGNGTGSMKLTPMSLMRRLASLVAPPGSHDTCYFGAFAAHASLRRRLVRSGEMEPDLCRTHPGCEEGHEETSTFPQIRRIRCQREPHELRQIIARQREHHGSGSGSYCKPILDQGPHYVACHITRALGCSERPGPCQEVWNLESFLAEHPGLPTFAGEEFRRYFDCRSQGLRGARMRHVQREVSGSVALSFAVFEIAFATRRLMRFSS